MKNRQYSVKLIKDGFFEIHNDLNGHSYDVDVIAPSCTCEAWKYKKPKKCKHILVCEGVKDKKF